MHYGVNCVIARIPKRSNRRKIFKICGGCVVKPVLPFRCPPFFRILGWHIIFHQRRRPDYIHSIIFIKKFRRPYIGKKHIPTAVGNNNKFFFTPGNAILRAGISKSTFTTGPYQVKDSIICSRYRRIAKNTPFSNLRCKY